MSWGKYVLWTIQCWGEKRLQKISSLRFWSWHFRLQKSMQNTQLSLLKATVSTCRDGIVVKTPQTALFFPQCWTHLCPPYASLTSTNNKHIIRTDHLSPTEKQALAVAQNDHKSMDLGNKYTSFLPEDNTSYLPMTTGLSALTRGQAQDTQTSTRVVVTGRAPTAPAGTEYGL